MIRTRRLSSSASISQHPSMTARTAATLSMATRTDAMVLLRNISLRPGMITERSGKEPLPETLGDTRPVESVPSRSEAESEHGWLLKLGHPVGDIGPLWQVFGKTAKPLPMVRAIKQQWPCS